MFLNLRVVSALHTILFLVCGTLMIAVGIARADTPDLVSSDSFRHAGVRVFDDSAVGTGCRLFGFCDSATLGQVNYTSITRAQSDHSGEPVVAKCTVNDLVHVEMIARNNSDEILEGWASAGGLNINHPIEPCGPLS